MIHIHPFPARMAPDLALEHIMRLDEGSIVLDPMAGSGTVLRQAARSGHTAIGFDMDPLAVLMSRVATSPCNLDMLVPLAVRAVDEAMIVDGRKVTLPWIDRDPETKKFINFWFAQPQRLALRKLVHVFFASRTFQKTPSEKMALLLAMSRLIVTKEQRASLARDTSHSRPHKVADENDFDVFPEFIKSTKRLQSILSEETLTDTTSVNLGDARNMHGVANGYVDAVITSPPYLNAIDYLRGHRMSLVWMGYSIPDLRAIRSNSIGAEKRPDTGNQTAIVNAIVSDVGDITALSRRHLGMVERYAGDLNGLMAEISRTLRAGGRATFVVGNSCLKGVFIKNSRAVGRAAEVNGLLQIDEVERELPAGSRYLPMADESNALSKRMRTECVMTFERTATV